MKKRNLLLILIIILVIAYISSINMTKQRKVSIKSKATNTNTKKVKKFTFKRCMNIGNALEAPKGVKWDVTMKKQYFDDIKKAGFDSVRIPVRFSDYAKDSPNYTLDENFMKQVDGYVNYALNDNLTVVLDFHHFVEIMQDPERYKQCFLSVWSQLAKRYKNYPDGLIFEVLNEPKYNLYGDRWNEYLSEAVSTIRKTNPNRRLVVGSDNYYSADTLQNLVIPKDKNIIVSFHYYEPDTFTFQENKYLGFENYKNVRWTGSEGEVDNIKKKFDIVENWARKNNVKVFLGEFGADKQAPVYDRQLWTETVRKQAEAHGFTWGYWELCSVFGIYNANTGKWDNNMLRTLIPKNNKER